MVKERVKLEGIFDNIWPPEYLLGENREEAIRLTLRKLFFYLIFLTIASIVILTMVPHLVYTFTTVLKGQFIDIDFESTAKEPIKFDDIRTVNDFWVYLTEVVVENLHNTKWYSTFGPITDTEKDDNKVLFENSLLGVPRLRQLRVKNDSCKIHEYFKYVYKNCYSLYSTYNEDKSAFGLKKGTAWIYSSPKKLQGIWHSGSVSSYNSGGYYQDLVRDKNKSIEIIEALNDGHWITRNTRVVFMDFTLYNANLNLFCIIKLTFEFPPTGGVVPSSTFQTVKLMRYMTKSDFAIMSCEFLYIGYIVFFIIQEIRNFRYFKWNYFMIFWSYVNICITLGSVLVFIFNLYKISIIPTQIKEINNNPDKYANFEYVGFWQIQVNNMQAILLFILWIKIFQYINLSKTMGQLSATLSRCWKDILGFSLMFFIIFFGFAQMGYLLFGSQINHFSTFGKALMTLLMTILGDFDYYEIEKHNKILAPIFFTTYIFFVFFVLFNMFLAIITDTYSEIKDEIKTKKSELEIIDFVLRLPWNIVRICCGPKLGGRNRPDLKLSGNEMISKIRELLELCNFSENEIGIFFSIYNINENKTIQDDDVHKLLLDIKTFRSNYGSERDKNRGYNNITVDSFMRQQDRIDSLGIQIQKLNEKVTELIVKHKLMPIKV